MAASRTLAGGSALLAVAAFALAACSAAGPEPVGTVGATSPVPSATASGLPDLDELVVSPAGLGDLRVGERVPSDSLYATWDARACQSEDEPTTGAWVAPYPKAVDDYFGAYDVIVAKHIRTGAVTEIDVWSSAVRTAEGIGAGSTLDELRAAYPDIAQVATDDLSMSYAIDGATSRLVFEVATPDPSLPDYWSADELGHVLWMRLLPLHGSVHGIAAAAAGACA